MKELNESLEVQLEACQHEVHRLKQERDYSHEKLRETKTVSRTKIGAGWVRLGEQEKAFPGEP